MNIVPGEVYLIGAGPGDPDLITVKGLKILQRADVVVHDRLVSNDMLKHCHENAELIDVGKYPDHHRVSQSEINEILVEQARRQRLVVRLKGGDPFVFGRGMEELEACRDHNVPCHIVPGISSCIAGPAAVGIPVTTRGQARSFAVVTGQTDPNLPEHKIHFDSLANIDTVVFMMGRKNLSYLTKSLMNSGRSPNTPVACIQQATMKGQRAVQGCLRDIVELADKAQLTSPVITIVGYVASLANNTEMHRSVAQILQQHECSNSSSTLTATS